MLRRFPPQCGVTCRLAHVLAEIFSTAQGVTVTLRPGQVAREARVSPIVVGQIFRALAERGYMTCSRVGERRLRCTVRRDSPLWSGDHEAIYAILQQL